MATQIGIIGAGSCDEKTYKTAYDAGAAIAKSGCLLICGGLGGVMEAACHGAKEAGGFTIGIVPGSNRKSANKYVDYEIVTNAGHARNIFIAHSADALVAISGSHGTLSEIAISLKLGKPVVGLGSWDIKGVTAMDDPSKAVGKALELIGEK